MSFFFIQCYIRHLPQPAGLTLPLKQRKNVTLAHGSLDVTHNGPGGIVDELHADLGDVTGVSGTSEDTVDLGELHRLIHIVLFWKKREGKRGEEEG